MHVFAGELDWAASLHEALQETTELTGSPLAPYHGVGMVAMRGRAAEAKQFIERYFARFASVRAFLDSRVAYAREHGYVTTIFNRRRYIPELRERNFSIRAFGERTAANSPIVPVQNISSAR